MRQCLPIPYIAVFVEIELKIAISRRTLSGRDPIVTRWNTGPTPHYTPHNSAIAAANFLRRRATTFSLWEPMESIKVVDWWIATRPLFFVLGDSVSDSAPGPGRPES